MEESGYEKNVGTCNGSSGGSYIFDRLLIR